MLLTCPNLRKVRQCAKGYTAKSSPTKNRFNPWDCFHSVYVSLSSTFLTLSEGRIFFLLASINLHKYGNEFGSQLILGQRTYPVGGECLFFFCYQQGAHLFFAIYPRKWQKVFNESGTPERTREHDRLVAYEKLRTTSWMVIRFKAPLYPTEGAVLPCVFLPSGEFTTLGMHMRTANHPIGTHAMEERGVLTFSHSQQALHLSAVRRRRRIFTFCFDRAFSPFCPSLLCQTRQRGVFAGVKIDFSPDR